MTDETQIVTAEESVSDPAPEALDRAHGLTWRKWVLVCAAGVFAVVFLYYLVTLIQVVRAGRQTEPARAEAIVVLGAAQYDGRPSPQLAARLDHALALYDQGVAPVVMVTGGNQPGDRFTEAEASAEYLVDRGVPETAMMREDAGRTTYESLDAAADQLLEAGLDDVVLVTDPYHSLRSRLIAEEVGLDADLSPTPTSVVTGWSSFRRELAEAGGVAVGRVIGFDRLSDLTG
jgi:uncharacterized SAM-binding protein YcdF (DUF218 family)